MGFRKLYLWKNPKQNVVVLYELRKLQKMIKLIPEMPEINNRGPSSFFLRRHPFN